MERGLAVIISQKIREKLAAKHNVTPDEVDQCFANRTGKSLIDIREEHASDPPTLWFIAETDYGRKLKVVFVLKEDNSYLRTAFSPNEEELRIYAKFGNFAV